MFKYHQQFQSCPFILFSFINPYTSSLLLRECYRKIGAWSLIKTLQISSIYLLCSKTLVLLLILLFRYSMKEKNSHTFHLLCYFRRVNFVFSQLALGILKLDKKWMNIEKTIKIIMCRNERLEYPLCWII